jgi:ceramide synthetase
MFIHHIATTLLLSFSYVVNFVRIGSLVLVIHDFGDFWLEVRDELIKKKRQKIFIIFISRLLK